MALDRGTGGSDPARAEPAQQQAEVRRHRRVARSSLLGHATLACPECDAPLALAAEPLPVVEALACPFCAHAAPARDFLSLAPPTRPMRVEVRVARRAPTAAPAA